MVIVIKLHGRKRDVQLSAFLVRCVKDLGWSEILFTPCLLLPISHASKTLQMAKSRCFEPRERQSRTTKASLPLKLTFRYCRTFLCTALFRVLSLPPIHIQTKHALHSIQHQDQISVKTNYWLYLATQFPKSEPVFNFIPVE